MLLLVEHRRLKFLPVIRELPQSRTAWVLKRVVQFMAIDFSIVVGVEFQLFLIGLFQMTQQSQCLVPQFSDVDLHCNPPHCQMQPGMLVRIYCSCSAQSSPNQRRDLCGALGLAGQVSRVRGSNLVGGSLGM